MGSYVIRGGIEGRERLRILARALAPTTADLLTEVGVPTTPSAGAIPHGFRCLDIGCGGGDVATLLAGRLPTSSVLGIDLDEVKLELARTEADAASLTNVEFRRGDILRLDFDVASFDLVYARFLLTHLSDPAQALANMADLLAPEGTLVIEDIDFTGHFCDPPSPAFARYVDLYTRLVQGHGCDPNIGPRLPRLLKAAGLHAVCTRVVQPVSFDGDVKLAAPITLEAIAEGLLEARLVSAKELTGVVDELYACARDDDTLMSFPRIVQTWGRRTA